MKKIIEIFYEYLANPQKKHNLMHIIEICKKQNILEKQANILQLIIKDQKDDSTVNR